MVLLPRLIGAYLLGVAIGNLILLPTIGVMLVAILPASIIFGLPFLAFAILVLLIAPAWVHQNLGLATSIAAFATPAIWFFYDRPQEAAGWQRLTLCIASALIASTIFYGWNKLRPT